MLSIYPQNSPPFFGSNTFELMMRMDKNEQNEYLQSSSEGIFADNIVNRPLEVFRQPQSPRHNQSSMSSPLNKQQKPSVESTGSKWYEKSRKLGPDFQPGRFDVICARGKAAWNHSGNKNFRDLVQQAIGAYSKANSKAGRTLIVSKIVESIRSKGTGFVKKEASTGEWIEVGDLLAREKAGQMLRNALSSIYRSSIKNKKQRRKSVHAKRLDDLHDIMASNERIQLSMVTLKEGAINCGSLSDKELLDFFTQEQCTMLEHIKTDEALADRFHQAEVSACLVTNFDDTDSDGDAQMAYI